MFIILVYDFGVKRVGKALKICRKYLHWVQNSVFEGEISKANLVKLQKELDSLVNVKEDSVIMYTFRSKKYTKREIIGKEKGTIDFFI